MGSRGTNALAVTSSSPRNTFAICTIVRQSRTCVSHSDISEIYRVEYPDYLCWLSANIGALEDTYGTGISPCPQPNMESPHMYDNSEYQKATGLINVKVKSNNHLYPDEYSELAELSGPEISLDLHGLIDEAPFNEGSLGTMIQEIQGLHVEKPGQQVGGG